ncbi:MAG: efflux RND transporter periplasmic adaptor subunit [Myxococcales bacterium]|nr:efflux RND transporter periplasmic adaptor subunit [Myxococcales bacterium]
MRSRFSSPKFAVWIGLFAMLAFALVAVYYLAFLPVPSPKQQTAQAPKPSKKQEKPQEKQAKQPAQPKTPVRLGDGSHKQEETPTVPNKGIEVSAKLRDKGTVQLFQVKRRERIKSLRVVGEVETPNHAIQHIGARAAGRVVRFFVEEGTYVRKGKALLQLDSPAVGKARSRYLRMHALWKLAEAELSRQTRLRKLELNSVSQLAHMRTNAARAKIEYNDAIAQLRILGVPVPKRGATKINGLHTLYAMRQGAITHIPAKLGQWVTPEAFLLQIEDRRNVWIHLRYPLALAPIVKEGTRVSFTGSGLPHALFGKIEHISEHVMREQQNLQARVDMPNSKRLLRPGQLLEAHLPQSTEGEQAPLLVPDESVQRLGLSSVVFLYNKGYAHPRKVIIGASQQGWSEVLFGLQEGETVVARGAFLLKSVLLQAASPQASHHH